MWCNISRRVTTEYWIVWFVQWQLSMVGEKRIFCVHLVVYIMFSFESSAIHTVYNVLHTIAGAHALTDSLIQAYRPM